MPPSFEYRPGYLSDGFATRLLVDLTEQADWRLEHLRVFGREYPSPRLACWYGAPGTGYRYSSAMHRACGWLPVLAELAAQLGRDLAAAAPPEFNFVLLNRYRDGSDSMGWHADDEPELGANPLIASISLGATRRLLVRPRSSPAAGPKRSTPIDLEHGSLLVMRDNSQADYEHSLARTRRATGERINLTFRRVLSL